ncbi:tetratricopeptide repeat protein [Leptolyngbya sp. FACHB-541]|uniref:serine/threonine-protein kinase n=1 Tax=Leptolyngbya sp. FACHB-541 TaxID=2692810 RepID=UPI001688D190|nr:serine/threonine-protein kinase [Leptolyngbya sp. FACHB-541]MBD1997455.1 tetratricopeptide repeat protein [Leptolyngbya sp. FACHB-541]
MRPKPHYCVNPTCPNPADPDSASATVCRHCNSTLLLQNRYRVKRQVGEGGFGKTYLIEDTLNIKAGKTETQKVLKVLLNQSPIAAKLFQREAKVLRQLRHPGIPKVEEESFQFRLGAGAETLHCLVMEFIEGVDLNSWANSRGKLRRPVTQAQAIAWLKQLVDILGVLHNNSVQQCFHRDIKPSNIICRPNGQLVLIDFGAVREVTPTMLVKVGGGQALTGICSPGYAPPEQIDGRPLPQSDFFALGRTLVHLLTGKHPLELDADLYTGELRWRDQAPSISTPLADLIDHLMAPTVGKRPPNTDAIWQRLDAIEQGYDLQDYPQKQDHEQETALLPPKRAGLKKLRLALAVPGVAIALGLGGVTWQWGAMRMATVYHERGITHQIAEELYLAQVELERAIALKPDYPEAYFHLGRNYEQLGDLEQARTAYETAQQAGLPEAYSNLARLDILAGQPEQAISLLQAGLKLEQNDTIRYSMLKNLGWAYLTQANYTEAASYLNAAIQLNDEEASAYCLMAQLAEVQGSPEVVTNWESCRRYASRMHPDQRQWLQQAEQYLTTIQEDAQPKTQPGIQSGQSSTRSTRERDQPSIQPPAPHDLQRLATDGGR